MKYSSSQFPNCCDITGVLHEIWDNGWFDEYSAQHILIKAICDKTIDFRRKNEIIQSSINLYQNCDNADTFIANISSCLYQLKQHCSEDIPDSAKFAAPKPQKNVITELFPLFYNAPMIHPMGEME